MSEPLFSIVTVTLNCVVDALRTADSVLEQEFQDYEYIVKDGGSKDGTRDKLQALGVSVWEMADAGIYDAMNQALELCEGKYIYFLNAGDTFPKRDTLKSIADAINQNAALCYGNIFLKPMNRCFENPQRLTRYYLFRKYVNHQSWMVRSDVFAQVGGFDTTYKYVADQDLLRKIALRHKLTCQYIDETFAVFEYGGASTKSSAVKAVSAEHKRLLESHYAKWERYLFGVASLQCLLPLKRWLWYRLYPFCNDEGSSAEVDHAEERVHPLNH